MTAPRYHEPLGVRSAKAFSSRPRARDRGPRRSEPPRTLAATDLGGSIDIVSNDAEARRRARASWPIRAVKLGREELVDPRDRSTVDERVALVWQLTLEQWALAGREFPDYRRSDAPGRVVRPP
jgi:hypothetical protein